MDKPNIFSVHREEITSENISGVGGIWTEPGRMKEAWIKMGYDEKQKFREVRYVWELATSHSQLQRKVHKQKQWKLTCKR